MTLAEIISAVRDNTNRTDKDAVATTGVKFGLDRIFARHKFRGNTTEVDVDISAGQSEITMPSGWVNLQSARFLTDLTSTQSWTINIRHKGWITRRYPNPESITTSFPYLGYLEGEKLKLLPGVTASALIRLTIDSVPVMTADTDETNIPVIDEAVVAYATAHVLRSIMMFAEATQWELVFGRALADAVRVDMANSAEVHAMDLNSDDRPLIEPYLDPFAGHSRTGYGN